MSGTIAAPWPKEVGARKFNVQEEGRRVHRLETFGTVVVYIGAGALIAFGLLFLLDAIAFSAWILLPLAALALASGAVIGRMVYRDRRRALEAVEVHPAGVAFHQVPPAVHVLRWSDASVKVLLADYSEVRFREWSLGPLAQYVVLAGPVRGGISHDAFDAIRQSAVAAGVQVVDAWKGKGRSKKRLTYIGDWPDARAAAVPTWRLRRPQR